MAAASVNGAALPSRSLTDVSQTTKRSIGVGTSIVDLHVEYRLHHEVGRDYLLVDLAFPGTDAPFLVPGDKTYNVGLYNQPFYAFGKKVHPKADPWDGKGLAVLHDRADAYWRAVILGSPGDGATGSRARSWRRAEITTPHTVQADGESLPAGRFTVTVTVGPLWTIETPSQASSIKSTIST